MLVFISYPRELEVTATRLDAELQDRGIDKFLDREGIHLADPWKLPIEANIKKAGIYIVLYLPEAAVPGRFFRTEIDRIQVECRNDIKKKLITVIFPPTKPRDLPPLFGNRQIREADERGESDHESHGYWIDKIIQEVERLNEIERLEKIQANEAQKKIKWRQIIARITLASAGGIIIFLLWGPAPGESLCNSLVGNYALHQNYVFTEGIDTRSVATNAAWKAIRCEYNPRQSNYILRGEEDTDFEIEAIINGKYERIATAKYHYNSEVFISKDGTLLGRSFEAVLHPKDINKNYKDRYGNGFNKPDGFIDKKIDEVIDLRNKKHKELKTTPCIPALGTTGGRVAVAFVCEGYTRTMIKMS
jgi:hypothetical protein